MRSISTRQITGKDIGLMHAVLDVFGEAFGEQHTYGHARPSVTYFEELLSSKSFIAVAAIVDGIVVGGLAAYELKKFEQARSEIYIYDLAVATKYRRKGVATTLIEALKEIAARRGAYVIFVQADCGDEPAIKLYSKLGRREDVLHFDIEPMVRGGGAL